MNIYEVALRIVLAIVIGGVVGFNREYENRPAGFRTHVLVCLGATVAALIQVQLGYYVVNEIAKTPNLSGVLSVDIGRVICQVISGVGFLGAGTIIRTKASVKGLTTAASIWAVACVGIAVGMGFYTISVLSGIGIVIALVLLKRFEYRFINKLDVIKFKIEYTDKAKVIKEIKAKVKFALTGTPIENSLVELWSIFDFIMPGYLFDEKKFKQKFVNRSEREIDELKSLINPFILRRLKRDVITELPEKIEKKYYVPMTTEQKLAYKNYMKEVKLKLKTGEDDNITIFSYLTRLRQICQDPILVNKDYTGDSGKLNVALEIIEEVIKEDNKILVFSQFTSVLKKIEEELNKRNIVSKYLDGSTRAKERIRLVSDFNESKESGVFLISLKAGGTGLNLTSAKFVMHMDPWWNPAIEDQATDRAHRIGQKNVVEVIKLIAKDTIEEKVVQLQEEKREIINSVMSDDSLNINNISKLTNEEILELFK